MKKNFLVLFMALGLAAGVNAQEQQESVAADGNNEVAKSESINHWSLAVKGGVNYLRNTDKKVNFEVGGEVERTFNPRWGLGLEYMFLKNDHDANNGFADMEGNHQDINVFLSFNLSNILAPYRSCTWFNWYAKTGVGATIYKYQFDGKDEETGAKILGVASTDVEFNVCKYVALFLEGQFRMNPNKESNGYNGSRSHLGANFGVRVLFGGERNIRNIAWGDYIPGVEIPDFGPIFDAQKKEMDAKAAEQQKAIDDQNEQIKKLQQQIKFTQDSLDRHIKATKPKVAYKPTAEESQIIKTALSNLEFESGNAIIKNSSFTYLDGLAGLLAKHPEWSVKLNGHTDNSGKAAANLKLSQDRANAVKDYLVSKGADAANIEAEGFGQTKPIASNNTAAGKAKNRRVEVELFSK